MSDHDATGVTVLRCTGNAKATKQWQWNPTLQQWTRISYQAGAKFTAAEHQVADLAGLAALLEQLRSDPAAFIVRGALAPDAAAAVAADPTHRIRRRKLNKGGVAPTLVEASRAWIGVDFDSWPLRPSDDLATDPDSAIDAAIRELLPEPFHDAEAFWVLSSSAGFVPGYLKAHVWFWLTEPATNEHLKAVLKQCAPGIDHALYNAAQVHFAADPIVLNGYDPIPRRTGWRKGLEPAVALPALLPTRKPIIPAGTASPGRKGSALDALAYLGDGENGQGFHAPLRSATLRYARDAARSGNRNDAHIKASLLQAVQDAPARPDRSLADYSDDYLQRLIDGAVALLAGQADIVTMRPHHAPATQSVEEARDAIGTHVGGFFARTLAWHGLDDAGKAEHPPAHVGILAGVGTGKSTAARAPLPAFVQAAKAAELPYRALWLVPTHKLGAESLAEMQRLGINAAVLRGRDAIVPGTGDPENYVAPERMCLNLDAVADALAIGANVEESVCGSATSGKPSCPWRSGPGQCAFQAQKPAVAEADVVIAAHQSLFHELAKEARADLAAVIVDESWWQAGLIEARDVHLDGFAQEPLSYPVLERGPQPGPRPRAHILDTADLHTSSAKVQRAFKATLPGQLLGKATVEDAGLTARECAAAAVLEWRRKVEGVIFPGQTATVRRERMKEAAGNAVIPRRVAIWRALQALLEGQDTHTGRLERGTRTTPEGTADTIVLHSRLEIRPKLAALPMLLLDATLPVNIVRHFLPRLELLADTRPAEPHTRVVQVMGGWGKTTLCPNPKAGPNDPENRRRARMVRQLADFAGLNSGGDALVITYEAIEGAFARPGVRTEHFNGFIGLDQYRDVRTVFVIGRPLPKARDLRAMALALTGRPIPVQDAQAETRGALMADGSGSAVTVRAYADPDLEALRAAVTDAAIVQAAGRGRGVNRDENHPLTVVLMADVVSPLPVARMVRWEDVRPSRVASMASRGLLLTSAEDAARVYPDLYDTPMAAAHDLGRQGAISLPSPYESIFIGEWQGNQLQPVRYKPDGRGQQWRRAWVHPDRLDTLPADLSAALGKPVQVDAAPVAPEPTPAVRKPPAPRPAAPGATPPTPPPPLQPGAGHPRALELHAIGCAQEAGTLHPAMTRAPRDDGWHHGTPRGSGVKNAATDTGADAGAGASPAGLEVLARLELACWRAPPAAPGACWAGLGVLACRLGCPGAAARVAASWRGCWHLDLAHLDPTRLPGWSCWAAGAAHVRLGQGHIGHTGQNRNRV